MANCANVYRNRIGEVDLAPQGHRAFVVSDNVRYQTPSRTQRNDTGTSILQKGSTWSREAGARSIHGFSVKSRIFGQVDVAHPSLAEFGNDAVMETAGGSVLHAAIEADGCALSRERASHQKGKRRPSEQKQSSKQKGACPC
jgi:hypothetical protein